MNLLIALAMTLSAQNPTAPAETLPSEERLTLGGGCFWCVEAVYDELRGVSSAVSGYAGGHADNPTYKQVVSGRTGHAEVVQITFDPRVINRDLLLDVFFTVHDPTTLNRQGNDVGTQYRSAAYYETPEQRAAIEAAMTRAAVHWNGPFTTEVKPLTTFWPAEDYHQEYFQLNGSQPYCSLVIAPKMAKFRKRYAEWLKQE